MKANEYVFFFFNDTATTEIYTLSLHDALPILVLKATLTYDKGTIIIHGLAHLPFAMLDPRTNVLRALALHYSNIDRKSTRLNSSHANISYAVFCLKKKTYATSYTHNHQSTSIL